MSRDWNVLLGDLTMRSLCEATMVAENEARIGHHAGDKFQYVPVIFCLMPARPHSFENIWDDSRRGGGGVHK